MPFKGDDKRRWNRTSYETKQQSVTKTERRVPVSLRIKASLHGRAIAMLHEGIAHGTLTLKTPNDMYEKLIERGFASFKDQPIVQESEALREWEHATEQLSGSRKEAQAFATNTRHEITELLSIGRKEAAVQYFRAALNTAARMPPGVWRDWAIEDVEKAFPQLKKMIPAGLRLTGPSSKKKPSRRA